MPQGVNFGLPWPLRVNPHLDAARDRNIAWMHQFELLPQNDQAVATYLDWRLAEVAAYFYPEATPAGLKLATDLMGWYFAPFDDQFDTPLGRDPAAVARVCGSLTDALHEPPATTAAPSVVAFGDIWQRCHDGMPAAWRARAATHWAEYFAVHVTEAQLRCATLPLTDAESHLWRRRRSNGAFVVYDVAEGVSGFHVPEVLWHHQVLNQMREIAADVVTLCQDTTSVEKEERADDRRNNFLLILENHQGFSRRQSVAAAQRATTDLIQRFLALEEPARGLAQLVPTEQRPSIASYVRHLHDWMRGHDAWAAQSTRYDAVRGQHNAELADRHLLSTSASLAPRTSPS